MSDDEVRSLIKDNFPDKIENYSLAYGLVGAMHFISYSLELRPIVHNLIPSLNSQRDINDYSKNVLYYVTGESLETCYPIMSQKIRLNNCIKIDFKQNMRLGFRPTFKIKYQNFEYFFNPFEVSLVIETNSEAQFFAVVTVNPFHDAVYIIKALDDIKRRISKGEIIKMSGDDFDYENFYPPKKVFLYSDEFSEKKVELRKIFSKRGWNITFRDKYFFEKQRLESEEIIVLCEGSNYKMLNDLHIPKVSFSEEHYSVSIFQNIRTRKKFALRDKDYLLKEEKIRIVKQYPKYFILDYYSIENYLYHPVNIAEINPPKFSKEEYIKLIVESKNNFLATDPDIGIIRSCYSEFKDNHLKKVPNALPILMSELQSPDFEIFYQHFNLKKHFNKSCLSGLNLNEYKLSRTNWFTKKIKDIIQIKS